MIDSPGCGGLGVLLTADYQNLAISVESISAGYTALGWEEERSLCWQDFLQLLKQCCDVGYNEEDVCLGNVFWVVQARVLSKVLQECGHFLGWEKTMASKLWVRVRWIYW